MKRFASLWLVFAAFGLVASSSYGQQQQPSDFQARLAAWQNPSRLVRQPPPNTDPLPSPSDRPPAMAPGPRSGPALPLPAAAAPPQVSNYQPSVEMHQPMAQESYPGEMIQGDGYYDDSMGGYGGGDCCGPTCGPGGCGGCGIFGGPGLFGRGRLGGRCGGDMCGQSCGPSCGQGCGCDSYMGGGDMCCGPTLWWLDVDFTFGWRRGKGYPTLVTGEPDGVLPGAENLYKAGNETSQMNPGMRIDVGTWIDQCQVIGVGGRFWFLGKDSGDYSVTSDNQPVIARPFFDADLEQQDALLVAFPGLRSGGVAIQATNEVLGGDAYMRMLLMKTCYGRIDAIGGYQFSRINDDFRIVSNTLALADDGGIIEGTTFRIEDQFDTRNEFHGGSLGLMWERECCGWTWNVMGKVGLGNMRQTAIVNGFNTVTVPGAAAVTEQGGLLTADTNIGQLTRDEFCAVPELNLGLSYRIRPCLSLSVGYNFMYWTDVLRPGDIIDTTIDTDGTLETRPLLALNSSNYWVQGLNLGMHYDW
jgi:hypothetical protein